MHHKPVRTWLTRVMRKPCFCQSRTTSRAVRIGCFPRTQGEHTHSITLLGYSTNSILTQISPQIFVFMYITPTLFSLFTHQSRMFPWGAPQGVSLHTYCSCIAAPTTCSVYVTSHVCYKHSPSCRRGLSVA